MRHAAGTRGVSSAELVGLASTPPRRRRPLRPSDVVHATQQPPQNTSSSIITTSGPAIRSTTLSCCRCSRRSSSLSAVGLPGTPCALHCPQRHPLQSCTHRILRRPCE